MYPYIRYPSVNLIHSADIDILLRDEVPSFCSSCRCAGLGCLYRADMVIPLGAFGVSTGVGTRVARLALGVAAPPVLRVFVCVGIGFHQSRVWRISFWCSPIVCRAFGWWRLVSVCVCAFGVGDVGGVAVPWLAWALWG